VTQGRRKGENGLRTGVWRANKWGKQIDLELPALRGRREEGIRRASGNCGGGRHSGVRCWRPRGIVALGWGCQQQEARAVRSKKATRGRGAEGGRRRARAAHYAGGS
jgi:hypothetical protein